MADAATITADTAILALELSILGTLDRVPERGWCLGLRGVSDRTGIPREVCRGVIRGLIDKGLAEYHRGLFTEDHETAGSGYCITDKGRELVQAEWGDDD